MKRHFAFVYNGETIEVSAQREGDTVIIERDGRSYTVTITDENGEAEKYFGASGSSGMSDTSDKGAGGETAATSLQSSSVGEVPAPMTGVIKDVLVAKGDLVAEGEKLMIMEAMKMDIEVSATIGGTVQQISVKVNDSVQEGQPLVRIG